VPAPVAADRLKVWQRFHIRLSILYGGLVLAVLLSVTAFFYLRGVASEQTGLAARLRIGATSLASAITAEELEGLRTAADVETPAYKRLDARFREVAAAEPDFSDLYIMRRGPKPGSLEMVVDAVILADAPPAKPGEPYEADRETKMLEGFDHPVVEDDIYTDAWGTVLSGYAPIRDARGTAVAIVGIDVRASRIAAIKREVAMLSLGVLAVALLAMVLLAVIVGRSIRKPLSQIMAATDAIAKGELHVRAELVRNDEFGVVGRHFDDMATGLQERDFIKNTFGQYVAPEVVQRMISGRSEALHGQRRHAAVMFTDVRGFTTLSEAMSPEEVVTLLNDYLDRMTAVITKRGGRIDKFIGDAIMCDWGTLGDAPDPERAAVDTALAMQRELAAWNAERALKGAPALSIGTAIHAGPVVAGSIGSARKLEYTVIGDAVNVASRLEGLCKTFGARIVVSGAVVEAAKLVDQARWLDRVTLRGRQEKTDVYEVLADDDPRRARMAAYKAATDLLRAGELEAARAALLDLQDNDPAVRRHLERLAHNRDSAVSL
jgi:class 3 adenylate cyclase